MPAVTNHIVLTSHIIVSPACCAIECACHPSDRMRSSIQSAINSSPQQLVKGSRCSCACKEALLLLLLLLLLLFLCAYASFTHAHTHTHTHTCARTHARTHTNTNTHAHTRTHAHQVLSSAWCE
jgi:Ca2+/H+ antiporter